MTIHDIRCTKGLDIQLISLKSGCWIRSKYGCFQRFFKFFAMLWPMSTDIRSDIRLIGLSFSRYFLIFCWNLSYLIEIWWIFSWYPFVISDIGLISLLSWYPVYRFSASCYPLSNINIFASVPCYRIYLFVGMDFELPRLWEISWVTKYRSLDKHIFILSFVSTPGFKPWLSTFISFKGLSVNNCIGARLLVLLSRQSPSLRSHAFRRQAWQVCCIIGLATAAKQERRKIRVSFGTLCLAPLSPRSAW